MCNDQGIPSELLDKFKLLVEIIAAIAPYEFNGNHEFVDRYDSYSDAMEVLLNECAIAIHEYDKNFSLVPHSISSVTVNGNKIDLKFPIGLTYEVIENPEGNILYQAENTHYGILTHYESSRWESFNCAQEMANWIYETYALCDPENMTPGAKIIRSYWRRAVGIGE